MDQERVRTADSATADRNPLAFFTGFLRNPQQVGSVVPSSRYLERQIIRQAALHDARLVVELGPGTGGTTRAILRHAPADTKVLTIEMSRHFVDLIGAIDDPRLINHNGSAEQLTEILAGHGLGSPDVVISGIPFSTMPAQTGNNIVRAIHRNLAAGGRFIAYQLSRRVAELTTPVMGVPSSRLVIRNIPPMRVYRWQKAGQA